MRGRADRSQATDVPAPRSPAGGFGAADDPAAPSPPGSRSRPADRSDDPARASVSLSMPALASGNQINGGFYKGFFRSLLSSTIITRFNVPTTSTTAMPTVNWNSDRRNKRRTGRSADAASANG